MFFCCCFKFRSGESVLLCLLCLFVLLNMSILAFLKNTPATGQDCVVLWLQEQQLRKIVELKKVAGLENGIL